MTLFLVASTFAEAPDHRNAIGWNDGISYRRYVAPSWGIGISAGLDLQVNDDEIAGNRHRSTDYSPDPYYGGDASEASVTEGLQDGGTRSFRTAFEGFHEIRLSNWIRMTPFARTEYAYTWNDGYSANGISDTRNSTTESGEDTSWSTGIRSSDRISETIEHGVTAFIGLRPGILILDRIAIEKEFGLSLRYANVQGESTIRNSSGSRPTVQEERRESLDRNSWTLQSFGWSDALFSSIQIHVLF